MDETYNRVAMLYLESSRDSQIQISYNKPVKNILDIRDLLQLEDYLKFVSYFWGWEQ